MNDCTLTSFELFAGAGGLALGTELAGFRSVGIVERDRWACQTILDNQRNAHPLVRDWVVHCMDVRDFDWSTINDEIDLLAGGPPCQPFSIGGVGRSHNDSRDMFPSMITAVAALRPKAFVVENVKGLLRSQFADYFQYILLQLEFPERIRLRDESWIEHLQRLKKAKSSWKTADQELSYDVSWELLNAADYGVPQKRERVFIVGFRRDLGVAWSFPRKTHSRNSLLYTQREHGEYWERHGVSPSNDSTPLAVRPQDGLMPWVTVRDALSGMPSPTQDENGLLYNHLLKRGARFYPGHTGSSLDMPSKTLKAGVHGVPGGENMFVMDDGCPRYYTVREAARIQTFPDAYRLDGSWTEAMRQLGNAVPVKLAQTVTSSIAEQIVSVKARTVAHNPNKVKTNADH